MDLSLDHVGLALQDLHAGRRLYERLGFTLSPESLHLGALVPGGPLVPFGSGNHCAMFERGYFEILGLVDSTLPSNVKPLLDAYEGLHILALRTGSAAATHRDLRHRHIKAAAPILLQRDAQVGLTDLETRRAEFNNIVLDAEAFPEARLILIEHRTPEVLWQDHLARHDNGAIALAAVIICADNLPETVARFTPLLGAPELESYGARFSLLAGCLRAMTSDRIRAVIPPLAVTEQIHRLCAVEIEVRSLAVTQRLLIARGIPHLVAPSTESCTALWIGPQATGGCALAFFETKKEEPRP